MDRKSFFKTLLGGAAVAVIAPHILAEKSSDKAVAVDMATIPKGVSINDVVRVYRRTGELPYSIHSFHLDDEYMAKLFKKYRTMDIFETLDAISGK